MFSGFTCETCEGKGYVPDPYWFRRAENDYAFRTFAGDPTRPCRACYGTGRCVPRWRAGLADPLPKSPPFKGMTHFQTLLHLRSLVSRDVMPPIETIERMGWTDNDFRNARLGRLERFERDHPEVVAALDQATRLIDHHYTFTGDPA